jgi:predicted MFS family arabinose efflux permease
LKAVLTVVDQSTSCHGCLLWLALGTFAIGTEGFMIAGLLPGIAADLSVSIETAGQLVTVFALAYALTSPILTTLTGHLDRRRVLIGSMAAFALSNVLAFGATGYWSLMGARVLVALSAGLYVPNANALAAALVPAGRRGMALSIVNGGMTLALVFGVPLGAVVGNQLGWRTTFGGVAVLAVVAMAGLLAGLPRDLGRDMAVVTLRQRIAVVGRTDILLALLVTLLWSMGAFTIYTYLAPYLTAATNLEETEISSVLLMWGIAAAIGVFAGGALCDRVGTRTMVVATLVILAATFLSLSVLPFALRPAPSAAVLAAIGLWGLTAWAFYPSQLSRLVDTSGPSLAPIALSLNASFLNLGLSFGALLGSITLSQGSAVNLGWVGAICEMAALVFLNASVRRQRTRPISAWSRG